MMAAATLISCALFALGIGLAWPFLRWPADPHYGVFCFWALTRKPGEPLPKQYVCNNQGFTRIFLNYLMVLLFALAGKKDSLFKARLFQTAVVSLNGVGVYLVGSGVLGLHPFAAISGALIFLFMSTRPRFDFLRINCEHFYALALLCALPVFLLADPATAPGLLLCMAAMGLLTFLAINAKIVYLGELGLLGLGLWFWRGMDIAFLLGLAGAGLAALVSFSLLFRKRMHREAVSNLMHYARWAASLFSWQSYRQLYRTQFSKTPLAGLAMLAFIGCVTGMGQPGGVIIAVLAVASVLTAVAQFRLALYHVHGLLPSWSLAAALSVNWAYALHPAAAMALLALFVLSCPRAFLELPAQYGQGPLLDRLRQALGPDYFGYYDTRLSLVVDHYRANSGPFLPWGICPQLYCLTGQKPHNTQFAYFSPGHAGYSRNQELLIRDLRRVEHPYIYDLSRQPVGHDSFNNIAAFLATGRAYAPEDRDQGITRYRLIRTVESEPRLGFSFYVRTSPALDALKVELANSRLAPGDLKVFEQDLLVLVAKLLRQRSMPLPRPTVMQALLAADRSGFALRTLYAMVFLALAGEAEQAKALFQRWAVPENALPTLSPTLALCTWGLGRTLGIVAPLPVTAAVLNQVPLYEDCGLVKFFQAIVLADQLASQERALLQEALANARTQEGDYADPVSRDRLTASLTGGGYARPAWWDATDRVLLLRMAPLAMLESFVEEHTGVGYSVCLATQISSVDAAARLMGFEAIVPLPDGPFSRHGSEVALETLRKQHFTKAVFIIREAAWSNWQEIVEAMSSLNVDAWYSYDEASADLGLVQQITLA